MTFKEIEKRGIINLIIPILLFIALALLCSCESNNERIERFKVSASIGKLSYRKALIDAVNNNDTTLTWKKLDSLYEIEIQKSIKHIYKDEK